MRAVALFVFVLTLRAQDPAAGVNFYSLEKERALGAQIAADYRKRAEPLVSPELLALVEALGRELIPAESRFTYTFELVAADDGVLHEPVALPGGFVFVPAALIRAARSRAEIAGMLAHAIAHVEARHATRQATRTQLMNTATVPLIFIGNWNGAMQQGAARAIPLSMVKFARSVELDADRVGAAMMAGAGYAPARLADYLERVAPPDPDPPDAGSPYPPKAGRVAALRALPAPAVDAPAPSDDIARWRELLDRVLPVQTRTPPHLAR